MSCAAAQRAAATQAVTEMLIMTTLATGRIATGTFQCSVIPGINASGTSVELTERLYLLFLAVSSMNHEILRWHGGWMSSRTSAPEGLCAARHSPLQLYGELSCREGSFGHGRSHGHRIGAHASLLSFFL